MIIQMHKLASRHHGSRMQRVAAGCMVGVLLAAAAVGVAAAAEREQQCAGRGSRGEPTCSALDVPGWSNLWKLSEKMSRFRRVLGAFKKENIVHNFRNIGNLGFPVAMVFRADGTDRGTTSTSVPAVAALPNAKPEVQRDVAKILDGMAFQWPDDATGEDVEFQLGPWLQKHWTTGMVVVKVDSPTSARILHERYSLGNDETSRCVSWSMCKSFISALVGVAVDQGLIDISATITEYVPELKAFKGATVEQVLQMSSGVLFREDYFNPFSELNRMSYATALGWSMDSLMESLVRERPPGEFRKYVSVDTQVLSMVVRRVAQQTVNPSTGSFYMSLSEFASENIWKKVGFEDDALWVLDNDTDRSEIAMGMLSARTRDWARFGWLYLNEGISPATREQVVSKDWVVRSTTIRDADSKKNQHLMPLAGDTGLTNLHQMFGYGYQWWLGPKDDEDSKLRGDADPRKLRGDFCAMGIYGQMVYVSPEDGIIIAKNAADPNYPKYKRILTNGKEENTLPTQTFRAFREIARRLRDY